MRRLTARLFAVSLLSAIAACSHSAPETAATPVDEPAPTPVGMAVSPTAMAGSYRISAQIQSSRGGTARSTQTGSMQLAQTATAAPLSSSNSGTQLNATISLQGYTRAPRGRSGQAGAWWPIGGDSVVVGFAAQGAAEIQLRGAIHGRTIQGDVWYFSSGSGATFQMGTFTATKGR